MSEAKLRMFEPAVAQCGCAASTTSSAADGAPRVGRPRGLKMDHQAFFPLATAAAVLALLVGARPAFVCRDDKTLRVGGAVSLAALAGIVVFYWPTISSIMVPPTE